MTKRHKPAGLGCGLLFPGWLRREAERAGLEFAAMYVPEVRVSGIEMTPIGPNPIRMIILEMHQFQLLAGWTHKF